jgi:hypothetical protein
MNVHRQLRPALVLALAGPVALALAAGAASPPLVVEDATGDANAVNDQGLGQALGQGSAGTATPAQLASADLVKATVANTWAGKRCTGFTVTMELADDVDPSAPLIYRLMGHTTRNNGVFQVYLDNSPAGGGSVLRYGAEEEGETFFLETDDNSVPLATPAEVKGRTITFRVSDREIAAIGDKPGNKLYDVELDVRASNGRSFAPLIDATGTDSSFTICG